MSVLAVKINLCNTLFPYRGDYMDKDNERILLANVIGECIKSLQLDKNINQKELALLSGVSERSLRRIERGQVQAVSCSILIQYNFTQTKRPEVRKNRDFRSFFRTIPQAVIRPSTSKYRHYYYASDCYKTASGNQAFNSAKIHPFLLFINGYKTASGNQAFNFNKHEIQEAACTSYKTASGNQAFNPVARTRLTERA